VTALPRPATTWERLAPVPISNGGFVSAAVGGEIVIAGGTTWNCDT
jgi:hypothetical protein